MNMSMGETEGSTGVSKIADMINSIRASLDELEATVQGEEQGESIPEEEPVPEDSETISEGTPIPAMPMKKKSALDRFAGM